MYHGWWSLGDTMNQDFTSHDIGLFLREDVSSPNPVKSRSREIECYNDRFAMKFDRHLGSAAAVLPVKFQSDWKSLNPNLPASRLREILR